MTSLVQLVDGVNSGIRIFTGATSVPYTAHVTNVSVWSQTDQPPISSLIQQSHLKLFGHIARAAASEDHSHALRASTSLLNGVAQEADLVSPGFEQSTVI